MADAAIRIGEVVGVDVKRGEAKRTFAHSDLLEFAYLGKR